MVAASAFWGDIRNESTEKRSHKWENAFLAFGLFSVQSEMFRYYIDGIEAGDVYQHSTLFGGYPI